MKPPAMQFYVRDWMTDPALSLCKPATRGIWIDLLCAMWFATPRGVISGTPETLSRLARCSPAEMRSAILDLDRNGAASVTRNAKVTLRHTKVTLSNRRMAREDKSRNQARLRAERHRGKSPSNGKVTVPSAVSAVSAVASAIDCKTKEREKGEPPAAHKRILSLSFPHGCSEKQRQATLQTVTQAERAGVPYAFLEAAITSKKADGPAWKRIDDAIGKARKIVEAVNEACGRKRFSDLQNLVDTATTEGTAGLPSRVCGFSLRKILERCGATIGAEAPASVPQPAAPESPDPG